MDSWSWNTGTPRERAMMVRDHHIRGTCLGNKQILGDLFNLTEDGVEKILNGADWHPDHERPSINYVE